MKKIFVRVPTLQDARIEHQCCAEELLRKGVEIIYGSAASSMIVTKDFTIIFDGSGMAPDEVRDHQCDACFGYSEEDQRCLNRSHEPTDFKGSFLEYIFNHGKE